MNSAIIEFGSNIEPWTNIRSAKEFIGSAFKVLNESSLLKTEPVGASGQDDYINCAVLIETDKHIGEVKKILDGVERKLGRIKGGDKFASRTIDLDIIVWNNKIVHKDYHEREYVRINIGEIMPESELSE
jgi:2-amino-4-hydroxy-6-hydroxymethyldihydropteridine diphosphokinase